MLPLILLILLIPAQILPALIPKLGFIERIGAVTQGDADKNALIILECLCQMMTICIADNVKSIEPLFVDG